jgi:uroporphyrinogen-III synthase
VIGVRVLVTRPEPGASETAARLRALGHEPLVLPLSETRPLAVTAPDGSAIAITSANAVRHAPPSLLQSLAGKPCFAVGKRTAKAANAAGFRDVRSADRDAAALAELVLAQIPAGASLVYLCGRVRRPDFEAALRERGIRVIPVETYDTTRRDIDEETAARMLAGRAADAALVYSATAAEALAEVAALPLAARLFSATRFFCLSERVAQALGPRLARRAVAAPEPTEAAMLSLVGSIREPLDSFPAARL